MNAQCALDLNRYILLMISGTTQGMVVLGGNWTVVIARDNEGVFVETDKVDFDQLYKALLQ